MLDDWVVEVVVRWAVRLVHIHTRATGMCPVLQGTTHFGVSLLGPRMFQSHLLFSLVRVTCNGFKRFVQADVNLIDDMIVCAIFL